MPNTEGIYLLFICIVVLLGFWTYITNPFASRHSLFKNPYGSFFDKNKIGIQTIYDIRIRRGIHHTFLAYVYCAWQIVYYRFKKPRETIAHTVNTIIEEILHERFNPRRPYLISGDHFVEHYPRNLGVFYYSAFDASASLNEKDWIRRQQILLQTLYFDISVYKKAKKLTTTVVPMSRHSVSLINIYAYPSDTLYSIFYGLYALKTDRVLTKLYPYKTIYPSYGLQTKQSVDELLTHNRQELSKLLDDYIEKVYDPKKGLIRTTIHLSVTKDITRRICSFYDNVILWRTLELAQELRIVSSYRINVIKLKGRILSAFWREKEGIFIEDLSHESRKNVFYSSDWLVVLFTCFLKINHKTESVYYKRIIKYIKKHQIDLPFPLKYHTENRGYRQYPVVRAFLPEYGGSAIWSFWGMEYIKLLILMHQETKDKQYLLDAKKHTDSYTKNIEKFRGFPEVYGKDGSMLRRGLYTSVLRTGWVVNYLQIKKMMSNLD
jgi:hypothetical protein